MMVRVDLHTHSSGSPDGGITLAGYRKALRLKKLDYIAITDHNRIDTALAIKKELGDRIIVGEEIMTNQGEIIGLYLTRLVPAGLTVTETVEAIKTQGGLVLAPHPFETHRKGLSENVLGTVAANIDMVEIRNGRALFQNRSKQARSWAATHQVSGVACSDAHSSYGLGKTYINLPHKPTKQSLVELLKTAELSTKLAPIPSLLAPKMNRLKRNLRPPAKAK